MSSNLDAVSHFRMVVLDMDGTVLNSSHKLTERTIRTLGRLSASGVKICFATGRSSLSVFSYLEILSLVQEHIPIICFNGSVCLTLSKDGTTSELFSYPLSLDSARTLINFASARGEVAQYYDGVSGNVYACPKTEEHRSLLERYAALTGRTQVFLDTYDSLLESMRPAKLLVLTNQIDDLLAASRGELSPEMFHMIRGSPHPFFVEYLKPSVNKGASLIALAEHLNMGLDEIIAFGDGDNDIEMLSCGCYGVAMANARANVKSAAVVTTPLSNDEDGVAALLEELESSGKFRI